MFSVVILKENGDVIARPAGTDQHSAEVRAKARRQDFPDAKEVRVIAHHLVGDCALRGSFVVSSF